MANRKIGNAVVDIDVEATRAFYSLVKPRNACDCAGCRNFRKWAENSPPAVGEFLREIGIDDLCYASVSPCGAGREKYAQDRRIFYTGFYHVVGRKIDGGEGRFAMAGGSTMLTEAFSVTLNEGPLLDAPVGLPGPILQIGFQALIPWLLDETNIYVYD